MRIADCGLEKKTAMTAFGFRGLLLPHQSAIRNPQSAIAWG
jgi:hypothetical protein